MNDFHSNQPPSIFWDAQVKIFHAGSTETIFRISISCSCWDLWQISLQIVLEPCLYSTWLTFIEFVFKLVVAFWVAHVIKNTLRNPWGSPLNSSDRKCVLTENKQAWPECHITELLTNLASSSRTGQYWPSVVLYGPRCARSVLSRSRANIPRYGPRARLVRGYYFFPRGHGNESCNLICS